MGVTMTFPLLAALLDRRRGQGKQYWHSATIFAIDQVEACDRDVRPRVVPLLDVSDGTEFGRFELARPADLGPRQ